LKQRLDQVLVERGLVDSREKGKALILAGQVLVNGQKVDKAGAQVGADAEVELLEQLRYVSRGGLKMEGALRDFGIDVMGRVCIDIGTSTGGFTDCLLQHGAARVHCVDVGATQIAWRLKTDARVVLHEHQNARVIEPAVIGEAASLLVCDVSFISVTLLLERFPALLEPEGEMVILVKPQFEVGRADVGKGGIVRDEGLHEAACDKVESALRDLGYETQRIPSPILGGKGNKEFLVHARRNS
jgi:23S rRNA (cytidine1920-2'-O)/16S rRNA (cytidine1409-2'-O)-methyltransferase